MREKKKSRQQLSAEHIARAALKHIDAQGLEAFSFRKLAQILGCEAMSIYHYYPSKTHLYDAMLNICLAEIPVTRHPGGWLEGLRAVCHAFRAMALRHPGFFPYIALHRLNTRPALGFLDGVLKLFEESGRDAEWRARRFRALGYYLIGALLDETSGYSKGPSAAEPVADDIVARDFPAVLSAGPYFAREHHSKTFEHGLETLLQNLADEVAASHRA